MPQPLVWGVWFEQSMHFPLLSQQPLGQVCALQPEGTQALFWQI